MDKGGSRLETGKNGKKSDKRLKRKKSPLRTLLIVLGVIAGLCLTAFAAWRIGVTPPVINPSDQPEHLESTSSAPPSATPTADTSSSTKPTTGLTLRDGVYTVLLVGTFDDGNTDTIMVATLDTKAKTLDVMSIPRDTTTLWNGKDAKINSIYSRGGGDDDGMITLQREIGSLVGFIPNNYAMVKMKGFKALVDTIGGVEFDVPMNMYHYDGKNTINLKKGVQTLKGDKALQLMRFRGYSQNNPAGVDHDDFGRIEMQQQFLMATFKQMMSLNNLTKVFEYIEIAQDSIQPTDLKLKNMLWFAEMILGVKSENINFHTLPTLTSSTGGYYENVVADEALKLINDTINPYDGDITLSRVEWPQH